MLININIPVFIVWVNLGGSLFDVFLPNVLKLQKTTEHLSACSLCAEKTVSKWHQAAKYDIEIWHYCPVSPLSVLCTWFYPWFHINLKGKWIRVQEAASNICAQNILWHRLCISLSVSNSMKVTRRRRRGFIRIVKGRDEFTDADEEVHLFFTFGEHKSTESCMLVFACIWRKRNAKHGAWLFLKSSSSSQILTKVRVKAK